MIVRLPMSVPSHCSLLRGAADQLAERLAATSIQSPAIRVLHNFDGQPRQNADEIRSALHEQLLRPVRWSATIARLQADGVSTYPEYGTDKVLGGLKKAIVKEPS